MNTIIISGGNIDYDFVLSFIKNHKECRIIAADKGMEFCYDNGITPEHLIGDFDSMNPQVWEAVRTNPNITIHQLKPEKDDSDTESALHLAMELGVTGIYLLGVTGTRLDHVMANLQLLTYGLRQGIQVIIVDPYNYIVAYNHSFSLRRKEQFGDYVSFYSMGDLVGNLTLTGFKYPLTNHQLTNYNCGLSLSNEIVEETAKVEFTTGTLMMIMSRD